MRLRTAAAAVVAGIMVLAAIPAAAADKVGVGFVGNSSDACFFIAEGKGYFAKEGIEVEHLNFDSGAKMMAPLGAGELDVGSGATSAALFNAAARDIAIKVVADRSRMAAGYGVMALMVRADLVASGSYKGYADLKNLKIALTAPGSSIASLLNEAALKGGSKFSDLNVVYMGYPQQVTAFANKALDASIVFEPFASTLVAQNAAVRVASTEEFYPSAQIGLVYYSAKLAKGRPDVALRFMKAYLRAIRDYNEAVDKGRLKSTPLADEIAGLLAKGLNTPVAEIKASFLPAIDRNGVPNLDGMAKDLAFFKANGDVKNAVIKVDDVLDLSFVKAAAKALDGG